MSMENAKAFYEKVKVDQGLQQKIGSLVQQDPAGMEAAIIKVAGESGFQFSLAELKEFLKKTAESESQSRELNDAELESVAGGAGTKDQQAILSIFSLGIGCIISVATTGQACVASQIS
jgi:predicted ribosomally synthesized peptide with nif11-like leader